MRLLVFADTEPELGTSIRDYASAASVDAIICAGDLFGPDIAELADLNIPKLGVYGNHCNGQYFDKLGIVNLHLRRIVLRGVRFGGLQGCVRYKPGPSDILYTQDQYRTMLEGLGPVEVLVTHCPPAGINDHADPAHRGIVALRTWVDTHQPKVMIHGHTYPRDPLGQHGPTRIEYVHGTKLVDIDAPAVPPGS